MQSHLLHKYKIQQQTTISLQLSTVKYSLDQVQYSDVNGISSKGTGILIVKEMIDWASPIKRENIEVSKNVIAKAFRYFGSLTAKVDGINLKKNKVITKNAIHQNKRIKEKINRKEQIKDKELRINEYY